MVKTKEIDWVDGNEIVEGRYLCTEYGEIFDRKNHNFIEYVDKGYKLVFLETKNKGKIGFMVHRVVANLFIEKQDCVTYDNHVDHIDSNKLNNHYSNLSFISLEENSSKGNKGSLIKDKKKKEKMREDQVIWICNRFYENSPKTIILLFKNKFKFNLKSWTYKRIIQGRSWTKITKSYDLKKVKTSNKIYSGKDKRLSKFNGNYFGNKYEVYEDSTIISYQRPIPRKLKPFSDGRRGYLKVRLYDVNGKAHDIFVHRLVAELFVKGKSKNKNRVNHIDGNLLNNHKNNLEWKSNIENIRHAIANNLSESRKKQLSYEEVHEICYRKWKLEQPLKVISREMGISYHAIKKISQGKNYARISVMYKTRSGKSELSSSANSEKFEDIVISLYFNGFSINEIDKYLEGVFKKKIPLEETISVINSELKEFEQWKNRTLKSCYPFIFFDINHFNLKINGEIIDKVIFTVIGVDMDGYKEFLTLFIGRRISSETWLKLLRELKSKGVEEILIASVSHFSSLKPAINKVYPKTRVYKSIIHQIIDTLKALNYNQRKVLSKELKKIYSCPNSNLGYEKLISLSQKFPEHTLLFKAWFDNWSRLNYIYNYPIEIRNIICNTKVINTSNVVESANGDFQKLIYNKIIFYSDDELLKALYILSINIKKKWVRKVGKWNEVLEILMKEFPNRIEKYLFKKNF